MYQPLNIKSQATSINTTSLTPKSGLDLRTLPQLLSPENALVLKNYLITGDGGLEKRKGLDNLHGFIYSELDTNLQAYYRFDEGFGTSATDSSTNSNTGTITGATYVAAQTRFGLEFDGASGDVQVTDHASIQNIFDGGGAFSVRLNPYSDGENNLGYLARKGNGIFIFASNETSGKIRINFQQGFSGTNGLWQTDVVISLNEASVFTIDYDNSSVSNDPIFYIDGSPVTATEISTPVGTRTTDVGSDLYMGDNGGGSRTWHGIIDEVRIYNQTLTAAQVSNLYLIQDSVTMLEKWTDDLYVVGVGKSVFLYSKSGDLQALVKNDFTTEGFSGARYGDYFFVASPGDNIGRMSFTLNYDAQTGNFATGLVVTGGTSGATAIILEDNDAGVTGTLTLGSISGTFQDNEALTDSATGAAVVNGILNYTYTEVSNAPIAKVIKAIGIRLFAGDLEENRTAVRYSLEDDGSTNPPFTNWTVATTATGAGLLSYRGAGTVNVLESIGKDVVVVGAEDGKWAFRIDTIDSAGTLSKVDTKLMWMLDSGMKAAISTDEGMFYVNSQGVWQLVSIGQEDIKYSDQEFLISEKLGDNFFKNANFDDATFAKDDKTNQLIVSYREDSSSNNQCLVYNTQLKAFGTFTGWNINDFLNDEGTLYGVGSNTAKLWEVLEGNDDDGSDIWYEFEQELNVGQLWTRKSLLGEYIQGELSPSTTPLVKFSIYDKDGVFIDDKLELQWNYAVSELKATGYGSSSWGTGFGGGTGKAGTVENFAGGKYKIANFQRIRINISGNDKAAHTINWVSLLTKEKANIRRRNLIDLTG